MPNISQLKKGQMDSALKETGVWHNIVVPDVVEPLRMRLRSISSNASRTWDHKRFREQRRFYVDDKVPPIEVLDQNDCDKIADVLCLEWDVTEDTGEPLPCTKENVRSVMAQLPDVRYDVLQKAAGKEAYRLAEVAAVSKNSGAPSTQTSDTGAAAQ